MRRFKIISLMALAVALPAASASAFLFTRGEKPAEKPCFAAGNAGYSLSSAASAKHVVRVATDGAPANLRMQLVDDPAAADFVLVDEGDAADACNGVTRIESIRIDPQAREPDLTVALTQEKADARIYVKSARFTAQEAAALFAVIWQGSNTTGSIGRQTRRN